MSVPNTQKLFSLTKIFECMKAKLTRNHWLPKAKRKIKFSSLRNENSLFYLSEQMNEYLH